MLHIPAHKNINHPGAQAVEPRPQEREACTCGAVRHWECNAGCRAEYKNAASRIPPASESLYLPLRSTRANGQPLDTEE